jgi:hypothetical protein
MSTRRSRRCSAFRVRVADGYHSPGALVFTRRQFLASLAVPLTLGQTRGRPAQTVPTGVAVPRTPGGYPPFPAFDADAVGRQLRQQFGDLRNHFIFDYYPWYGTNPWRHW